MTDLGTRLKLLEFVASGGPAGRDLARILDHLGLPTRRLEELESLLDGMIKEWVLKKYQYLDRASRRQHGVTAYSVTHHGLEELRGLIETQPETGRNKTHEQQGGAV